MARPVLPRTSQYAVAPAKRCPFSPTLCCYHEDTWNQVRGPHQAQVARGATDGDGEGCHAPKTLFMPALSLCSGPPLCQLITSAFRITWAFWALGSVSVASCSQDTCTLVNIDLALSSTSSCPFLDQGPPPCRPCSRKSKKRSSPWFLWCELNALVKVTESWPTWVGNH